MSLFSSFAQSCDFAEGNEPWKDYIRYSREGNINGAIVFTKIYLDGGVLSTVCDDMANSIVIHYRVETSTLANGTYALQMSTDLATWRITGFTGFDNVTATQNGPEDDFTGTFTVSNSSPSELCLELWFKTFGDNGPTGTSGKDWTLTYIDELGNVDQSNDAISIGTLPAPFALFIENEIVGSPYVYSTSTDIAGIENCLNFPNGNTTSSSVRLDGDLLLDDLHYCANGDLFASNPAQAEAGIYFTDNSKLTLGLSTDFEAIQNYVFLNACPNETWDGIYLEDGATLDLSDAIIENWSTGIVAGNNCSVRLKDCSITSIVDWDGIVMGSNATLTIDGCTLERIGDKIQLGEGSTLNVIDSRIEHTQGSQIIEWNGIDAGPISSIDLHKSTIRQAQVGITAVDGSKIEMDDTIISDCGTGMDLTDSDFSLFDRNFIFNCIIGISATDNKGSQTAAALRNIRSSDLANASRFYNLEQAITSEGNWDMAYLKIYDVVEGIYIEDASSAGVEDCQINADTYAISGENSDLGIERNWLQDPVYGAIGQRAIRLRECHMSQVSNNRHIGGSNIPLFVWRSDMVGIQNNNDMTATTSSRFQTFIVSSNGVTFTKNTINCDVAIAPVRVSRSDDSDWNQNSITDMSANDLLQVFDSDRFMSYNGDSNITYAFVGGSGSDGVVLLNSADSDLECHYIDVGKDAIKYRTGSNTTRLYTNTLNAGGYDLITASVLGVQDDHGNCFLGGSADASALDPFDVLQSQFIYEPGNPCIVPTNVNPSNWFRPLGNAVPECLPNNNGGNGFNKNEDEVCVLVDLLEGKHATEPNRYFIDMVHLINYYLQDTSLTIPDCITASLDSLDPCGLLSLSEMISSEQSSQIYLDTALKASMNYHLDEIVSSTGADSVFHAQQIEEAGVILAENKLMHALEQENIYNNIITDLQEVSCTDTIANTWKVVLDIYAESMLADSLTIDQIKDLEVAAAHCADDYGDPVHWARDLLLLYNDNQTDYSVYDNCIPLKNRATVAVQTDMVSVFPNPTTGIINVEGLSSEYPTHVVVYDMAGRSVTSTTLSASQGQVNLTDLQVGVYVVEVVNGSSVSTHRIIIAR